MCLNQQAIIWTMVYKTMDFIKKHLIFKAQGN